jgi:myo-inositol-1(or 4)-monophosphatase
VTSDARDKGPGERNLPALLALAVEVAAAAGRLLVEGRPDGLGVAATKTSPVDIVTEMDTAAERLIISRLRQARPGDAFLGEEGGQSGVAPGPAGRAQVTWVIDPIDGTVNYLYRIPAWAVSIAAQVEGRSVVGVVHSPPLGETYTAIRGGGAFCGGRRLAVNPDVPLDRALVGTGFGYEAARRSGQARILRSVLPAVRDIRRAGSAALDLCAVAAGRLDAYYERGVQLWDIAAGSLIAEEAGARVGGLAGAEASPELTIAAAPALFEALHDLLLPLEPTRD